MMTRKHYLRAVRIVKDIDFGKPYNCTEFACVVDAFAKFFASDNPKFNRERFEQACLDATKHKDTLKGVAEL